MMEFVGDVVDLDVGDEQYGRTALSWASYGGKTECVKLLIDAGADLNVRDKEGITALYLASYYGNTECVKLLRDAGATE